ncbi:MAG TPA: iron ABC transporter permease [bacterium]|nr:iron ABC transporter permease [bacterium]
MKTLTLRRWMGLNALLAALAVAVALAASLAGESPLPFFTAWKDWAPEQKDILWVSRLPRVLLAALAGMALGSSGTAFQGLLRNALADPYILGVSSGAALGSILGLALKLPFAAVPVLAFATSIAAMLLVYRASMRSGRIAPHTLLLTGVILNAFLFAFILILNGLASFEQSQKILFLLIGNLETETYARIGCVAAIVVAGLVLLTAEGRALNLLTAGPETAQALGTDPDRHRRRIFFAASLMVGAVVPLAGLIGFIGLFVPHIARWTVGPDHRISIPASAWIGAMLLIVCDTIARTLLVSTAFQTELPVGAVTALVGAPFFLILMKKRGGS